MDVVAFAKKLKKDNRSVLGGKKTCGFGCGMGSNALIAMRICYRTMKLHTTIIATITCSQDQPTKSLKVKS
jgi:hypothetical protein